MNKKQFKVSPKGIIYYPFLFNPCTKFNPDGVFKVDLELDPNVPEHQVFLKELKNITPKGEKPPYRKQKHPESGEDTGNYIVVFKTTYKPQVFDSKGKLITQDCKIGNGTLARISYEPNHYKGFGGGINLYLKGVQILDLVEYEGASADYYGFDEQEGFEVKDNPFESKEFTEEDKEFRDKVVENAKKDQLDVNLDELGEDIEKEELPF